MACTTGCPTPGAHATWGECMRAKNTNVGYCQSSGEKGDYTAQKKLEKRIRNYRDARAQGVQPAGTAPHQVQRALEASEKHGVAFNASNVGRLDDKWTNAALKKAGV